MTDPNRPVRKHYVTAREHLAGVKASRAWIQDLAAKHLLDSQQPIKNTPYPVSGEPKQ